MDYIKRPHRGGHNTERVIERVVEKRTESTPQPIDIKALANALAQVMGTLPIGSRQYNGANGANVEDENVFDNAKTLERLANSMIVQKGNSESNFDNLGNEHQTKTDKEEIAKRIDLLSNLGD